MVKRTLAILLAASALGALTVPATAQPVCSAISAMSVPGLAPRALAAACDAMAAARARGIAGREDVLTVVDFTLPSTAPRLWVIDLASGRVLFNELVAHGAGSGDNYAVRFSNTMNSRQTSLGLYLTADTYNGEHGYSLRLRGLDSGVNDLAEERSIVVHSAWYVSPEQARQYGRLGRSWGCFALSPTSAPQVIAAIKDGSFVFAWGPGAAPSAPGAPSAPAMAASTMAARAAGRR
jgi:hypothetical protein